MPNLGNLGMSGGLGDIQGLLNDPSIMNQV